MTADVFKQIVDAELSRILRLNTVSNIVFNVEMSNGKEYHIRLTKSNTWYKAPEILIVKDSDKNNISSEIIKLSGAENSSSSTTIPASEGFVNRSTWNRTIYYIDPEKVQSMYYTFDVYQDSTVTEPTNDEE